MNIRSIVFTALLLSSFSAPAQSHRESPRYVCMQAALNYSSYGYDMNAHQWCSDVADLPEAICREAGLNYVIHGGDMQVKSWCLDTLSLREAYCRAEMLPRKFRTGYPVNVKDYCRN